MSETLPAPPALDQMAQADADRSEMCGETVAAAFLQALGFEVTPEQVIAWLRAQYGEAGVDAGTGGPQLLAALAHWGVSAHAVTGPIGTYLPAAIARGHYCLCAIYSDAGGNPDPSHHTGHWLGGYGDDSFLNPYGGRLVVYADLSAEDQQYGIEVDYDMGMTAQEKAAQALVDALLVRDMYLGRTSALADVQATAARMVAEGVDAGTWEVTGSTEAEQSGGLVGEMAAVKAQIAALTARLSADEAQTVAQAGQQAQQAAVAALQTQMKAIAAAAGGTQS